MAKEAFQVIFDTEEAGGGQVVALSGAPGVEATYKNGRLELTKAEAEKVDPKLKEICVVLGTVKKAKVIEVEAESASQAAIFVKKLVCGPGGQPTTNFLTAKASGVSETAPN